MSAYYLCCARQYADVLNHLELPANLEGSRQLFKQTAEFHSILQAAPGDLSKGQKTVQNQHQCGL